MKTLCYAIHVCKSNLLKTNCNTNSSNPLSFYFCLEFIILLEICSLKWRHHHCRWRAANIDLCSALMAIEQWGFFNVPHLLRHGPTVYNDHLRGPVTLIPVAERLAVWHYLFLRLRSVATGDRTPISRMPGERLIPFKYSEKK